MTFDAVFPDAVRTWGEKPLTLRMVNCSYWNTAGLTATVQEYLTALQKEGSGRGGQHRWVEEGPITVVFMSQQRANPVRTWVKCVGSLTEGDAVVTFYLVHPDSLTSNPIEQLAKSIDGVQPAPQEVPTEILEALSNNIARVYGYGYNRKVPSTSVLHPLKEPAAKRVPWLTKVQAYDKARRDMSKVYSRLYRGGGYLRYAAGGLRSAQRYARKHSLTLMLPPDAEPNALCESANRMTDQIEAEWKRLYASELELMEA